jgi:hypothetical protein
MPHPHGLSQWHDCVSTHLPHLSVPQRTVLALWSFGIVLAHSCGHTSGATLGAMLLHQSDQTVRERLHEWRRPAERKRGASQGGKRRDLDVTTCFAPLLRWVIQLLPTDCRTLAVAMDASTLGRGFTILNISVVIRGSAIPIAWTIVAATAKGARQPHWERLFGALRGVTPVDWTVIVLADRGLYARWLFHTITAMGRHPFLRINRQGQYGPADSAAYRPLLQVITKGAAPWRGRVTCFKTRERQPDCTLLARWDAAYAEP